MKTESINVHQLQAEASRVIRETGHGKVFQISRYSRPVAVVIPYEQYQKIGENCQLCVSHWRKVTSSKLSKRILKSER